MNISFHTGKSAMIAQAKALEVYGNNIANLNTYGYQTLRPDFADCIYESYRRDFVDSDNDGQKDILENDWQTGHGVYLQKTAFMFSESHFYETGMFLDFAIAGEGFFAVQDRWGETHYTRDGSFAMTQLNENGEAAEDGDWYLVSDAGEYVLDYEGNRIIVPFEDENSSSVDYGALRDMVGVYDFPNPYGLDALGTNRYSATGRSGEPVANLNEEKLQGVLIVSNVDLATQMVKLIETQRAYQISSRVVTTADELARIANNLR
ncbi:MAG: flagellar hook-basal body protein [Oscillospiraceae bacterium]|nr:flagellar hook-basal body protein [Oscillospiraceae bacterium]